MYRGQPRKLRGHSQAENHHGDQHARCLPLSAWAARAAMSPVCGGEQQSSDPKAGQQVDLRSEPVLEGDEKAPPPAWADGELAPIFPSIGRELDEHPALV